MFKLLNKEAVLSVFLVLALTACMTRQADLTAYYPSEKQQPAVFIAKNIEYDAQGRPVFGNRLKERPTADGEQFTLVQSDHERPVRSFDIAIMSERPDLTRPFKVIYEWTGKGFKAGAAGGKIYAETALMDKQRTAQPTTLSGTETVTAIGSVVLLGLGGFIVGTAASIPATAQELTRTVVNARETVISYSVYEYDSLQRLSSMRTYLPSDISQEIIKTVFSYENNESTPTKTEIISYPEDTVRTIP